MEESISVEPECSLWITTILLIVTGMYLVACVKHSAPVAFAKYSTSIVGDWRGMFGSSKETVAFDGDGTFICLIRPMGFLANTLSQSAAGKVSGTWNIYGTTITLKVTREQNENVDDRLTSSTIESFKADELTLKSERGETSSFQRVIRF